MRMFGKLGFVHRRLWRDDALYRLCLLLGPAPLVGAVIAAAAWSGAQAWRSAAPSAPLPSPPPWAVQHSQVWSVSAGQPHVVQPTALLPQRAEDGGLTGYRDGWQVTINPAVLKGALDVDVEPTPLSGFTLEGAGIDMAQLVAKGPREARFVGVGAALLVARTAGVYSLTAHLERPAGESADCLSRVGFGQHRLLSSLDINLVGDIAKTFEPVRFELAPGLYRLQWAFGCWEGQQESRTGALTILVGRPGEPAPRPARAGDFVRPAPMER
jgi:hypothetical protein